MAAVEVTEQTELVKKVRAVDMDDVRRRSAATQPAANGVATPGGA